MRPDATTSLEETKKYLTGISDELISDFIEIIKGDWGVSQKINNDDVFLFDIEVFVDGFGLGLYPMDKNLTQLGYKKLLAKYPDGPLRGFKFRLSTEAYNFDEEEDVKEMDEYYSAVKEFYFDWVSKCWDQAGGQNFEMPIYIMTHDTTESFDLRRKKWIDDTIKWGEQ